MKKIIGFLALVFAAVSLLSACDISSLVKISHQAEAESLFAYLSDGELEKAEDLIHKEYADSVQLAQISEFLDGRKVEKLEALGVHVNTKMTYGATNKEEQVTYKLTLDDSETVQITVIFLESDSGSGFSSVQLVLG